MSENTKRLVSIIINAVLAALTIMTMTFVLCGIKFDPSDMLSSSSVRAFRYFTFLSNILMGAIAIFYIVMQIVIKVGKLPEMPKYAVIIKFIGTVEVALTFFTVLFFLEPMILTRGYAFIDLYVNSNFFFHFICPVLAMVTFLFFENSEKLEFKHLFLSLIPMGAYAAYYVINCLTHVENGQVSPDYDFYGFVQAGAAFAAIPIIGVALATFLIAFLLRLANLKIQKKK